MKNKSLTIKLLLLLAGLTIFTIFVYVLAGPNGLIQYEKDQYNETHSEEQQEKNNEVVVK